MRPTTAVGPSRRSTATALLVIFALAACGDPRDLARDPSPVLEAGADTIESSAVTVPLRKDAPEAPSDVGADSLRGDLALSGSPEVELEAPAVWPAPDVVFDAPHDAVSDFVRQRLGVEPVLGEFRPSGEGAGTIEVQSDADVPPGEAVVRAIATVRQLAPTNGWYVMSVTSPGITIDTPLAGQTVDSGVIVVAGEGRGFESTMNVIAFVAENEASDLDLRIASGGLFDELAPYESSIDLSTAPNGTVVTVLVRGDTGLDADPGEFAAVPVLVGPTLPELR